MSQTAGQSWHKGGVMTDNRVATRRGNNDLYIRGINVSRERERLDGVNKPTHDAVLTTEL